MQRYFCFATKVPKSAVKGDPFDGSPLTIPSANDQERDLRVPLLDLPPGACRDCYAPHKPFHVGEAYGNMRTNTCLPL